MLILYDFTASPTPPQPTSSPISNHPKRLRSNMCREDWILPRKPSHSSISEEEMTLTLSQLVEEHSKNFPMRATVVSGLGEQLPPRTAITIHFLKQTKARIVEQGWLLGKIQKWIYAFKDDWLWLCCFSN